MSLSEILSVTDDDELWTKIAKLYVTSLTLPYNRDDRNKLNGWYKLNFNTQDDLFQIHFKIHIFVVFQD